jgi:hypothetical protein
MIFAHDVLFRETAGAHRRTWGMTHNHIGRVAIVSIAALTCAMLFANLTNVAMSAHHTTAAVLTAYAARG